MTEETSVETTPTSTGANFEKPWFKRHWKILAIIGGIVILSGTGILAWTLTHPKPKPISVNHTPTPTPTATPVPTPVTKISPLSGIRVSPELADRPVVSVIVENHPDARPQSGLSEAGVVYEALAEGGITRFQTFFLENRPASIGPVRSLRPYFVDWAHEFGAPVAHAGGSATALNMVNTTGLKSLNALVIGQPSFYRTNNRYAPHNLYTSGTLMANLLATRKLDQPATFTASPRKADAPSNPAPHPKITINYSYNLFQAAYVYDPAANDYARSLAGVAHIDQNTGKQIHVKNVVVEYMPTKTLADGHMEMSTMGRGQGIVFRDGTAISCTWVKDARNTRTKLLDDKGAEIPLNAGNTWYSIVPVGKSVTF